MSLIGRLKPGATVGAAQEEATVLADRMAKEHPEWNTLQPKLTPLREQVSGRLRPAMVVLSCAVGVVMLIVCANLSNLLLARMTGRQKEFAVRAALGAGRGRLMRQLLTESLLLSGAGSVVGLAFAYAGTAALARLEDMNVPLLNTVHLDWRAAVFCVVGAVVTGVLFGMAPALQVGGALMDSSRGASDNRQKGRLRNGLVVTEIALACVLMEGAGLLVRSFRALMEVNLLRYLTQRDGKTVSRKQLLEDVWNVREDTDTRAIDHFMSRLRKYIEPQPALPKYLLTVRGVGYRFESGVLRS